MLRIENENDVKQMLIQLNISLKVTLIYSHFSAWHLRPPHNHEAIKVSLTALITLSPNILNSLALVLPLRHAKPISR